MMAQNLKRALSKYLKWYTKPEEYRDYKRGCAVLQLAFVHESEPIEMGNVCILSTKKYWWYTSNPSIYGTHSTGYYDTEESAAKALKRYVLKEVVRVRNIDLPPLSQNLDQAVFRKSDQKACADLGCNSEDFLAGMDWMLRTMGLPQRPSWARYIVQNRDRSFTWFEEKPEKETGAGIWVAENGRTQHVEIDSKWVKTLRRIR